MKKSLFSKKTVLILSVFLLLAAAFGAVAGSVTFGNTIDKIEVRGDIDAGGNKVYNLGTPTNPDDAATKSYVDSQ